MTWAVVRLVGVSAPCAARLSGCAPCRNSRHGPSASILHACALRLPGGRKCSCAGIRLCMTRHMSRVLRPCSLRWVAWHAVLPHAGGQLAGVIATYRMGIGTVLVEPDRRRAMRGAGWMLQWLLASLRL